MQRNHQLSEHFTLGELVSSGFADRNAIDNMPDPQVIPSLTRLCDEILEPVRQHFKKPIRPNSAYRCERLNQAIGGSKNSRHCLGLAVDVEIAGVSNYELALWIEQHIQFDKLILECYRSGEPSSGWVHIALAPLGELGKNVSLTYTNQTYISGLIT